MRPVGSPHHAVRRHVDERAGERDDVAVGRPRSGDAVGACELHPDVPFPGEVQQHAERLLVEAERDVDPAEMVDDDGRSGARQAFGQADEGLGRRMKLDLPFQPRAPAGDAVEDPGIEDAAVPRIEREADAARTESIQALQVPEGGGGVELDDADEPAVAPGDGVERDRIVAPVQIGGGPRRRARCRASP